MNRWMGLALPGSVRAQTRDRAQQANLNAGLTLLGGLGLGAGLMYLFDPDRGKRRRALLRDSLVHARHVLNCATNKTACDLSHRAYGMWAEGRRMVSHDEPSDEVLEARVRARLGRAVSHPHAVHVTALNGHVTLSGDILADEIDDLLVCVGKVRGVHTVENQLNSYESAGDVSGLQGGRTRSQASFEWMQMSWSPTGRLIAGVTGGALMALCLKRRDPLGVTLGTIGFGMLTRGLTNQKMKSLMGVGNDCRAIEVQKTITINAPVGQVFDFWNDYRNFPSFMSNVREVRPDAGIGKRSHWTVAGPAGVPIEWTAEVTKFTRNKLLAWRTVPGSTVHSEGTVHFEQKRGGGTRVQVRLCYHPPGGALGHTLAKLFGADPKSEMDADLVRMKTLIETGHVPHHTPNGTSAGQTAAALVRTKTA